MTPQAASKLDSGSEDRDVDGKMAVKTDWEIPFPRVIEKVSISKNAEIKLASLVDPSVGFYRPSAIISLRSSSILDSPWHPSAG